MFPSVMMRNGEILEGEKIEKLAKPIINQLAEAGLSVDEGKIVLEKTRDILENNNKKIEKEKNIKIMFLCNGEKEGCKKTNCYKNADEYTCRHTSDIRYAMNFRPMECRDRIIYEEIRHEEK